MNRATALVLAGVLCLVAAAAMPIVGLALSDWDTDYVYAVQTGESYCADVVHDSPGVEGTAGYHVDYTNLSATGRQHFERALADGRYVVEDEDDVAPDFRFTDDHVAAGEGCYAVGYDGEMHALRTSRESRQVPLVDGRWPSIAIGMLVTLGGASLVAGVGLALKRRLA